MDFFLDEREYFEKRCEYVTKQYIKKRDSNRILVSLMQQNASQRLKELERLRPDDIHDETNKKVRLRLKLFIISSSIIK